MPHAAPGLRERLRSALVERLADPAEARSRAHVKRLVAALDRATDDEHVRSAVVEAAIAERLLERSCSLQLEVPTHAGRTADFRVALPDSEFHLHVKRWSPTGDDGAIRLAVPRRVRELERAPRPLLVGVRWPTAPRDVAAFVDAAKRFLEQASVGDEYVFRNDHGAAIAGVRVLAPWPGKHVVLTVGLDAAAGDEARRLQRLCRKACGQFMPGGANVILVCGGSDDRDGIDARTVDQAILGSHIERWDLFPPRGHRVAHGRAADGFWSGGRFPQSRVVAWCAFDPVRGLGRPVVWSRSDSGEDATLRAVVARALGASADVVSDPAPDRAPRPRRSRAAGRGEPPAREAR
ncbi:MAG: hypothetical protein U0572_10405 [Phycisphaerales bacterium]